MNNEQPSISITMTTYNGEKFLQQQIDSILEQSYQDFELIICDDMSTDNTLNIIDTYMKKHLNIELHKNIHRLGSVKNFEKAITLCKGKYIALSDQDDIWEKNKLEILIHEMKQLEQTDENTPIMIHSDLSMINEDNKTIERSYFKFRNYTLAKTKKLSYILGPCGVMGNTILMNKSLKKHILPFPNNLIVHDYWIALINEVYGKRITIEQPLVNYRIHETNLSNSAHNLSSHHLTTNIFNANLPYMGIGREKLLRTFLSNYTVPNADAELIKKFLTYLDFNTNKLAIFYTLVTFNFVKEGFYYRLKLFFKILITSKDRQKEREYGV